MSAWANTVERFRQMSRALQWSALGLLAIVLYLAWDAAIRPLSEDWNFEADRIQSMVNKVRATDRVVKQLRSPDMEPLVTAIGPVRVPTRTAEGSKLFNDVVLGVLQKHGASNANFSSRSRGKLGKAALPEVTGGIHRVDRLTGDLKFDASPAAAAAIIAALESSPYVESINTVRLTRDTGGKVKVALTIEAWMLTSEGASSPGGTS